MTNELYPNNNCGECPGWLALGEDGGPQTKEELINVMCCNCYTYKHQKYGDSACIICGDYIPEGQVCHTCFLNLTNGGRNI